MAQASRKVRRIRRLKNERRLATKYMEVALAQRDLARMVAAALEAELKKRDEKAKDGISEIKIIEDEPEVAPVE